VRRRSDPILRLSATRSPHPAEIAIENHAAAASGTADKPARMEYAFYKGCSIFAVMDPERDAAMAIL
jgi:hypothetical protein